MAPQRKLLLADDSITIQKVVNLTFADEGIEVVAVGNGSLAVERLAEVKPDLVLADVHMPGLNGYEVCEQVRQTPGFETVPVMLLVGSFEPFDETAAERAGANDFLTKPFQSIKQLINKVTSLLDAPAGSAAASPFANTAELTMPADSNENPREEEMPIAPNGAESFDSSSAGNDSAEIEYGSAGFVDDEMIETSAANDFSQTGKFDSASDFSQSFVEENDFQDDAEDSRQTAPLSVSEVEDFGLIDEPEPVAASGEEWELVEETARFESPSPANADYTVNFETVGETEPEFEVVQAQPVFASGEMNAETSEQFGAGQARGEVYDFTAASDYQSQSAAPEPRFEAENEIIAQPMDYEAAAPNMNQQTDSTLLEFNREKPLSFKLDDDDFLLDLEDEQPENVQNFQPNEISEPSRAVTPEVLAPGNQSSQALQIQSAPPASMEKAADAFGLSQMQFPPEVIEAIAQRVVEKLSDKVIEKIAWEIVPDRFDLIVRKQMQDKERSR